MVSLVSLLLLASCGWFQRQNVDDEPADLEDFASATPIPRQPIPASPDARTHAEDAKLLAAWLDRNMAQAYDRVGVQDPAWDAAARRFIRTAQPIVSGFPVDRTDLRHQAEQLLEQGCSDPLVLYLHALNLWALEKGSREVTLLFQRAAEGMRTVAYPRGVARFAASGLYRDYENSREAVGLRGAAASLELHWLLESTQDGSYREGDDVVLLEHLRTGTGESLFERNAEAIAAGVGATRWAEDWTREVVSGMKEEQLAWNARGYGWASEVTEEGWKGFRTHMRRARVSLLKAWRRRPDRPEPSLEMMGIALAGEAGPGESTRTWFDRAVTAQLDIEEAYSRMLNQLRPRWGGSYEEMLAFGRECLETRRFDTEVPRFLFTAVQDIEDDQRDPEHTRYETPDPFAAHDERAERTIWDEPGTFDLLSELFEGYLLEPAQNGSRSRWESLYAVSAYKAGRYPEAWQHLQAVDGRLHYGAVDCVDEPADWVVMRSAALAGPGAGQALQAEALFEAGKQAEARTLFLRASRSAQTDEARRYFDRSLALVALELDLNKGGWVDILPTPELLGWDRQLGQWRVEEDGSLRGTTDSIGLMLVNSARVGPDFEFSGEMEFVESTNGMFHGGLVFGHPKYGKHDWMSLRLERIPSGATTADLGPRFARAEATAWVDVGERARFLLQSWKGRITLFVNDKAAIQDHQPGEAFVARSDVRIGLGGVTFHNGFTLAFRDLKLRKLKAAPKPPKAATT